MKLRPFELGLVIVFGSLFLIALVLLRTHDSDTCVEEGTCADIGGSVTIWGTFPVSSIDPLLTEISEKDDSFKGVSYFYIPADDFDQAFLNALADQKPPDVILMSHEKMIEHRNRLQSVSYEDYPIRDFRSRYVDGAEIFALNDGIYAFPVMVDPLMMFWNRDLFSDQGLLNAPKTWEDLVGKYAPALTVRDFNRNIERSAVAMGGYGNIKNAFPVISMLLMQSDSAFVREEDGNKYRIIMDSDNNGDNGVFGKTLEFYNSFSSVNNSLYSWNKSMSLDRDSFLSEDLAIYFGLGSEGKDLEIKNPNLSFDISEIPQNLNGGNKRTYGNFYGFFVPKTAKNKNGAFKVIQILTSDTNAKKIANNLNMAPVSRDLVTAGSNDVYGRIIYQSVPNARGWLNPDIDRLNDIMDEEITDVGANRQSSSNAASDILVRLGQIY